MPRNLFLNGGLIKLKPGDKPTRSRLTMPPTNTNTATRNYQTGSGQPQKPASRLLQSPTPNYDAQNKQLQQLSGNNSSAPCQPPHPAVITRMADQHGKILSFLDQKQYTGTRIKNVWVYNMDTELEKISALLEQYPYVAVDTEYPGCIYMDRMPGPRDPQHYQYMYVKQNIDKTKIIQLGITLADEQGRMPLPVSTWQFNFDFNEDVEPKEMSSFDLLLNSGIDFSLLKNHGISPSYFGEKIIQSGLVMNDKLTWVCFAGSFDMAYLLRIMMNEKMPAQRHLFTKYLEVFFPKLMDIKSFVRVKLYQDGGLGKIADYLGVPREGTMHQAGSDSMLTVQTFFAMFNFFAKDKDKAEYREIFDEYNQDIYGFSNDQAYRNLSASFTEPSIKVAPSHQSMTDVVLQMEAQTFDPSNFHDQQSYMAAQQSSFDGSSQQFQQYQQQAAFLAQQPRFMMPPPAPQQSTEQHNYLLQQLMMQQPQTFQQMNYSQQQQFQQQMWLQQQQSNSLNPSGQSQYQSGGLPDYYQQ